MSFLKYLDKKIAKLTPLYVYCIVFALTLLVRFVAIVLFQKFLPLHSAFLPDSFVYFQQATAISEGRWITNGFPNGYPFIIALFSFLPDKEVMLLMLNMVLSSLVASIISFIVYKRTSSKFAAIISGIIIAFWYNQITWSITIMSEAPSTFFLVLGILLILQKKECSGGLALGIASVTRTLLLPIGLLIALFCRSYKILLVFLIPILLIMTASFFFSGNFSIGGYLGGYIYAAAQIMQNGQEAIISIPPGISTGQAVKMYISGMLKNPLKFIYARAQQLWLLWGFWPNEKSHNTVMTIMFNTLLGSRFLLLMFGLYFFIISKKKSAEDSLFLIPVIIITITHILLFSEYRSTYPVEPLLVALFVSHFYFFLQEKQRVQWLT